MYKKIYRTICAVTLSSLAVLSLFVVTVSYLIFSDYAHDSIKRETLLLADSINTQKSLTLLDEGSFSFLNSEVNVFTPEGVSLLDGSLKEELRGLTANGFTENGSMYAVILDNGNILTGNFDKYNLYSMLFIIIATAILVFIPVSVLSMHFASALTGQILAPLENIYLGEQDCMYEELLPFMRRLTAQTSEIKRQEKKVKEQKNRLQTISENMSEGLIVVDTNKSILLVNQSILDLFSAAEEDVKHRDFSLLTTDSKLIKHLENALSGKKEYTDFKTDTKSYGVFYSPVYDKQHVKGVVMLFIDASEQMKTEKIRREFSANVSHELKTPLTTIHGYSQIIASGLAKEENISEFAGKIEQESLRMINLIEDIINLSQLDEQADAPQKENIVLRDICLGVMESLAEKAQAKNVSVSLIAAPTHVFANKIQITEMVYNLLDNAIKYNKDGGNVQITITDSGFSVADTGIGIPERYLERIYERFFRADKSHSKKVGGTGLGLSIVKHIAGCNGAQITTESTEGEGTTFTVSFTN